MVTARIKDALREELKGLLVSWVALQDNPSATQRDYKRYRERIQEVEAALKAIEKDERGVW